MFSLKPSRLLVAMLVALAMVFATAGCEKKPEKQEIKIGNTNPYSGPASAYGTIGRAIAAYFKKINDEGGINGDMINFISYDDGYSPPKTVEQVRRLVEQDGVIATFQTLGTPTNTAIHEYMNTKQVPQMFVATGAGKWGQPDKFPWTMGWQPTYPTEAAIYAKYIRERIPDAKIGVLFQNDDYGKDYLEGFHAGLGAAKDKIVKEVSYEVTDPTIDSQIVQLKNSGANVFFNITTPKFAAQAIRKAADLNWKPTHFLNSVSNSVGGVMKQAGFEASEGIISAIYLKDPTDSQWQGTPEYEEFVKFLKEYLPDANVNDGFNVYGYTVAQTMVHVLRQAKGDYSRENLMKQAASINDLKLPMLLPGVNIQTGPDDFYPIECEQLVRFKGGTWERFGDVVCADK